MSASIRQLLEGPDEDLLGRGAREPKSGIEHLFDVISRSEYAMAGAVRAAANGEIGRIPSALWDGLRGKRRISFMDIAADELGLSTDPMFNIPDWKRVPDLFENVARGLSSPAGITGMALGLTLDPLSWISTFGLTKTGRLAELARAAKYGKVKGLFPFVEAGKVVFPKAEKVAILSETVPGKVLRYEWRHPVIEEGSKLARMMEHEFARTGTIPAPLHNTWAAQALDKQRALLQIEAPWPLNRVLSPGQPIPPTVELVRGLPFFQAATKLNDALKVLPIVNSARHFFSLADLPPEMLDRFAEHNARMRSMFTDRNPLAKTLVRLGKIFSSGNPDFDAANLAMLRAVDTPRHWVQTRMKQAIRQAPLADRWMGTSRYAIAAIDDAAPGTRLGIDAITEAQLKHIKQDLGMLPDEDLLYVTKLADKNLESPDFPVDVTEGAGMLGTVAGMADQIHSISDLAKRGDFVGLDFKLTSPQSSFNESVFGLPGVRRIFVDYDWGRPQREQLVTEVEKLASKKGPTPEDLDRIQLLRSSIANWKPSEDRTPWVMTAWTQDAKTNRWSIVDHHRFDTLDEVYDEVLRPSFAGKAAAEIDATVAFKSDAAKRGVEALRAGISVEIATLNEASRLGSRVDELLDVTAKQVTSERTDDLMDWGTLLESIAGEGGISPTSPILRGTERIAREGKMAAKRAVKKARKEGGEAAATVAGGTEYEHVQYLEQLVKNVNELRKKVKLPPLKSVLGNMDAEDIAKRLGYEADEIGSAAKQLEDELIRIAHTAKVWKDYSPWQEALVRMEKEQNPDLARLIRTRELLARMGMRTGPVQVKKHLAEKEKELAGFTIPAEKETIKKKLEASRLLRSQVTMPAAEVSIGRKFQERLLRKEKEIMRWSDVVEGWGDLPHNLRRAALLHRKLTRQWAEEEMKRGLLKSVREGYHPHVMLSKLSVLKNLGLVNDRKALQLQSLPFARQRRWQGSILDLHDELNDKVFVEDVLTAMAVRGVASARAVANHDFITSVLRDFGHKVDIRKINLDTLDSRMGVYLPKGQLGFIPFQTLTEKVARRNLKRVTGSTSGAKALRQTREEFNAPRLSMMEAMSRKATAKNALLEVHPDELKTVFGVTRDVPAYILPREIADWLNRANAISNTPAGLELAAGVIKRVRNVWVPWTLFLFPGYFTRNAIGAVMNNLYMGVTDWRNYLRARKMQEGKEFVLGRSAAGPELSAQKVLHESMEDGVVDAGMATREASFVGAGIPGDPERAIQKQIHDALKQARGDESKVQEVVKKYGPHRVLALGMKINEGIEGNVRLALYIDRRLKGDTRELAARAVRKAQFDYDEITPAEKWLRTYLLPFFIYTRKNIPFQIEHMMKHPEDFANTARTIRVLQASSSPQLEVLPQWMHESMPVRLGEDENGNGQFQYFTLRNWLPAAEVQGLFSPVRTLMGMMAPWFRLPIENQINYSFYFRRPLEEYGGQRAKFLWWNLSRREVEVLSTVRLLSEIDRLFPPSPESGTAGYRSGEFWDRLFASGFGLGKTFSMDMNRQKKIALGQQQRIIREYTITMNRARKRKDWATAEMLKREIADERRRTPDVVLPLSITGLPSAP